MAEKMPDRFTEVWLLKNEDGSYTEIDRVTGVSIYNQSYIGRCNMHWDGRYFIYHARNCKGERRLYCLSTTHEKAKRVRLLQCRIFCDDGVTRNYICSPAKYKEGKRCEYSSGRYFIFLKKTRYISVYDYSASLPRSHCGGGTATCAI